MGPDKRSTCFLASPAGSEIHPDVMGCVKVRFPWDRLQPPDDQCSDWVPVMQDNTGNSLAIPRVGWEVLVGFRDGDPDRPMVMGRMYNGADLPPESLPEGKTRTTFKTLTSPSPMGAAGGGALTSGSRGNDPGMTAAANEILIEDAAGSELISMQAQRDQNVAVANDKTENVLNRETNAIDGNEQVSIGSNHDTVVGEHRSATVQGDQLWSVLGNRLRKVGLDDTIDVLGMRSTVISGMHFRRVGTYDTVSVDALAELIGGCNIELSLKENVINAKRFCSLTVGGAVVEATFDKKEETAKTRRTELVGGTLRVSTDATYDLNAAVSRATTVGGTMKVDAAGKILLEGSSTWSLSTAQGSFEGASSIVLQAGSSEVSIGSGEVSIKASEVSICGATFIGSAEAQFNP